MTTCNAPITATPTDGEAFHTGRKLHRVECATHGLIHPGTTGPDHWSDAHRRTGEVWPVDRRAPTPTVAPGLDLDAVERAERAITPGEWRHGSVERHHVFCSEGDRSLLCPEAGRVLLRMNEHFPHDSDAAGIVALRNAAPALIAEVRALRAEVAERRETASRQLAAIGRVHDRISAKLAEAKRLADDALLIAEHEPTCAIGPDGQDADCNCRRAAIAAALEAL